MSLSNNWDADPTLQQAVRAFMAGDPEALSQLAEILRRYGGQPFADAVIVRLRAGVPLRVFGLLPEADRLQIGTVTPGRTAVAQPRAVLPGPRVPEALPEQGFVTVRVVAAHFGVSVKAVYRWMASGKIRCERRPGGSYRIPAAQFHVPGALTNLQADLEEE